MTFTTTEIGSHDNGVTMSNLLVDVQHALSKSVSIAREDSHGPMIVYLAQCVFDLWEGRAVLKIPSFPGYAIPFAKCTEPRWFDLGPIISQGRSRGRR